MNSSLTYWTIQDNQEIKPEIPKHIANLIIHMDNNFRPLCLIDALALAIRNIWKKNKTIDESLKNLAPNHRQHKDKLIKLTKDVLKILNKDN